MYFGKFAVFTEVLLFYRLSLPFSASMLRDRKSVPIISDLSRYVFVLHVCFFLFFFCKLSSPNFFHASILPLFVLPFYIS